MEVITPSGPFLHVGNVIKYITDNDKYYMNDELIDIAQEKSFYFPKKHMLMPVTPEYMDNDNAKYHVTHTWMPDMRALKMAEEALNRIYEPVYSNFRPLSFDESIELAEKHTSAGYLYKKMKLPKKKDVFTKAYDLLRDSYNRIMDGENVETIFEMAPKVEIRALEKLLSDDMSKRKQRTFVVSDTLHYLVGISLYSNFNSDIVKLCHDPKSWNGVGISIFHGGWNELAQHLTSSSNTFKCFDETAMESCVTLQLQRIIYDMRNRFITGKHAKLAKWYTENVMVSVVVDHRGNLYLKIGQNPSGHICTLIDNNHGLEFKGLYHIAKKSFSVEEVVNKYENAHVKIVGDDSITPIDPMNFTTGERMVGLWDDYDSSSVEIGFNTTLESEGTITQVQFLSFGFTWDVHAKQYTFVPNYDKLFANLFFYRRSNSWRLTLAKLFAMKVLCCNDLQKYIEVCHYINYIKVKHYNDLVAETQYDEILSMNALLSQDKSLVEIKRLVFNLD